MGATAAIDTTLSQPGSRHSDSQSLADPQPFINRNLITLKVVLFLVYGGLAALYSTLIPHMLHLGLNYAESRIILIVVPLVALLGPLAIAPLVDRCAAQKQALAGRNLRILTACTLLLGACAYAALLAVPPVHRSTAAAPRVSFGCDADGAAIFQERCSNEQECYRWPEPKEGRLVLTNCTYTCKSRQVERSEFERLRQQEVEAEEAEQKRAAEEAAAATESVVSRENGGDYDYEDSAGATASAEQRQRRQAAASDSADHGLVAPPHLCEVQRQEDGTQKATKCYAFAQSGFVVEVQAKLSGARNEPQNETVGAAEWCEHPLEGFQCQVPQRDVLWLQMWKNDKTCRPMVECQVVGAAAEGSVLRDSQCAKMLGDIDLTFWSYLIIRSVADILPAIAVMLLNTAIIIATRETSRGRGDVGRQLAFGSLGWALFPLVLGLCGVHAQLYVSVSVFVVCWVVAAIVLLLSAQMPLSPPEWWWHTKSGMLAIPLSAIRKYGPEIAAVTLVAVVLGVFWSVIDTYQTWHLIGLEEESGRGVLKFSYAIVALPAILLLWHSETVVDYCGHSNILMTALTLYILRYTGLAMIDHPSWSLFMSTFEPITLGLTWVTLVLYMRHLVPRRLTTVGQAVPVIAVFGVGRAVGAALGLVKEDESVAEVQRLYTGMAVAACVLAVLYFVLYNCVLVPRCAAQPEPRESQAELPGAVNGSYSPLRVYHNGRGRKGEFRY